MSTISMKSPHSRGDAVTPPLSATKSGSSSSLASPAQQQQQQQNPAGVSPTELEDAPVNLDLATEVIPGRLFFVSISQHPESTETMRFFNIDYDLLYRSYFADFGPLNISAVTKFCRAMEHHLHLAEIQDEVRLHKYNDTVAEYRNRIYGTERSIQRHSKGSKATPAAASGEGTSPNKGDPAATNASPGKRHHHSNLDAIAAPPSSPPERIKIVFYTSHSAHQRANAGCLIALFCVVVLGKTPKQTAAIFENVYPPFLPFRDASYGISTYNMTIYDCLCAVAKGIKLGWYDYTKFNAEEYDLYTQVPNGDWNWVIPGRMVGFSSPHDEIPDRQPQRLAQSFRAANVQLVVRLCEKFYDKRAFTEMGIRHVELPFEDGSIPCDSVCAHFLKLAEEMKTGSVAVHCKAGIGRTGTLIGLCAIKHFGFSAREYIAWARLYRPGSVMGPQQHFLLRTEKRLTKAGDLMRLQLSKQQREKEEAAAKQDRQNRKKVLGGVPVLSSANLASRNVAVAPPQLPYPNATEASDNRERTEAALFDSEKTVELHRFGRLRFATSRKMARQTPQFNPQMLALSSPGRDAFDMTTPSASYAPAAPSSRRGRSTMASRASGTKTPGAHSSRAISPVLADNNNGPLHDVDGSNVMSASMAATVPLQQVRSASSMSMSRPNPSGSYNNALARDRSILERKQGGRGQEKFQEQVMLEQTGQISKLAGATGTTSMPWKGPVLRPSTVGAASDILQDLLPGPHSFMGKAVHETNIAMPRSQTAIPSSPSLSFGDDRPTLLVNNSSSAAGAGMTSPGLQFPVRSQTPGVFQRLQQSGPGGSSFVSRMRRLAM